MSNAKAPMLFGPGLGTAARPGIDRSKQRGAAAPHRVLHGSAAAIGGPQVRLIEALRWDYIDCLAGPQVPASGADHLDRPERTPSASRCVRVLVETSV